MSNWLVPFKGRNSSGTYNLNFLWQENNTYVMDNHRAALWCWFQHMAPSDEVNLFHIDRHTDALTSYLTSWVSQCPDLYTTDLSKYLSLIDTNFTNLNTNLFRWDNYVSIFLEKYGNQVGCCYFATYHEGDDPNHHSVTDVKLWHLIDNIDYWMNNSDSTWICNIDLDYFCHELDGDFHVMYSDQFIIDLFVKIKNLLDSSKISVLTICFSPECCGGWNISEDIWAVIQPCLGTNMHLPP